MLQINTLRIKPTVTNQYGEDVIDLTAPGFVYTNDVTVTGSYIVTTDLAMRADLVAQILYNDIDKIDFVLKFNGISNPFSLDAGTTLIKGDPDEMTSNFASPVSSNPDQTNQDIRTKFFDATRLSKKDQARLALIQQKSKQFQNAASNLPPNMADVGSQEIKPNANGTVVFGGDVVPVSANCPAITMSKATVLAKILEQNTFNK